MAPRGEVLLDCAEPHSLPLCRHGRGGGYNGRRACFHGFPATIAGESFGSVPFHGRSFIFKRLDAPADKTGVAAETLMKTFAVPYLDRSITCKMASAAARNEAGCAAVGAAKSAPIVLGSIVGVSRDRLRRQRIGWPLRLSGRKGADRTPRYSCQPADSGSDRRQGRRRVVRHMDRGCRWRSVRRPTSTDGFLNLLDGKRVERRPPRRYDVEPGATG
jgi:hypothetical protein